MDPDPTGIPRKPKERHVNFRNARETDNQGYKGNLKNQGNKEKEGKPESH